MFLRFPGRAANLCCPVTFKFYMKSYLLLFLCAMLLLFALPRNGANMHSFPALEKLKQTCSSSRHIKHTCPRKCLAPHTDNKQQANNILIDCGQQLYAVMTYQKSTLYFAFAKLNTDVLPVSKKYLSPDLKADPDPPKRG